MFQVAVVSWAFIHCSTKNGSMRTVASSERELGRRVRRRVLYRRWPARARHPAPAPTPGVELLNPALLGGRRPLRLGDLPDPEEWVVPASIPVTDWFLSSDDWSRASAEPAADPTFDRIGGR